MTDEWTRSDRINSFAGVAAGALDTPLARTLRYDGLQNEPTRDWVAQVQRAAEEGRYGDDGRTAVGKVSASPRTVGLWVGGVFGGVFLLGSLVLVLQNNPRSALLPLVVGIVLFLALGGAAYWAASRARARLWRRHARVARFAADNGFGLLLSVDGQGLPRLARVSPRGTPSHSDLLVATVHGQTLLAGTRVSDHHVHHSHENQHIVREKFLWAALRVDPERVAALPEPAAFEARLRSLLPEGTLSVRLDDWLTVGIHQPRPDLDLILLHALFVTLDLAFEDGRSGS